MQLLIKWEKCKEERTIENVVVARKKEQNASALQLGLQNNKSLIFFQLMKNYNISRKSSA